MLSEKESFEKIIELKEALERSGHAFPSITIWKNKKQILEALKANSHEDPAWAERVEEAFAEAYVDFEKNEKVIEVDLGNAWSEKFHAYEYEAIDAFIK